MIIKLPAKINMDNEILKISILGKSVDKIPFSNIETISIKKTEKPISYWLFFIAFYFVVIYLIHQTIEYDYFLILFPFVFIVLFAFFKNLYTNSVMVKEYGCVPKEHFIYQRDKTKIKIIIAKIRMFINIRKIDQSNI